MVTSRHLRIGPPPPQHLSISKTKPLVIGADEYLVAWANFDLPRASDIERISAAQIQDYFFPRSKSYDDFLFLDAHDCSGRGWRLRAGAKVATCPGS